MRSPWKPIALYGALLAAGAIALQWLDYQTMVRRQSRELYIFIVAVAFLALGIYVGTRLWGARPEPGPAGNPKAVDALGLSPRELEVLQELAAGYSGKEIAARLKVSPNTVKTHTANLFRKLNAEGRVDAINRARELGILP